MAMPWKKVKGTRISRLVNDHLHISQKRRDGSSLVVETGFPTSLIDLFIKNREKLKKTPKKRRPVASPDDVCEGSPISCPFPPPPPPPPPPSLAGSPPPRSRPPSLARSPPPEGHASVVPPPPSRASEICAVGSGGGGGGGGALDSVAAEESGGGSYGDGDVNAVLIGIMKVFVVVVLALATKRLTVGITISAVLLLLLEYVGKHCPAAVMPAVRIGAKFSMHKKLEEKHEPSTKPVSLSTSASTSPIESTAEEIQPVIEINDDSLSQEIEELVEMAMKREESLPDFTECKKKSRKARIKSKMQKIVPKKFRGTKKEQDLPSPSTFSKECEESEKGSISSSISECSEEDDDKSAIICFDPRLSEVIEESETEIGEKCRKTEGALSRRYMPLCLIVLAGLIGGRPFALALTLLWFLVLKLGQALNPPMIMSFNVKSG